MLTHLHVQNFALMESLDLRPGPGLNILTGETGAGKSILIDALNAALGERTGTEAVRTGSDRALVEAVFDLSRCPSVVSRLAADGWLDEGETELVLSRELSLSGAGAARVNGRRVNVGALREIGDGLVDLHGQHEHQSLLRVATHQQILDAFGGPEAAEALSLAAQAFGAWRDASTELNNLLLDERERARLIDLHEFQVNEIDAAELSPGEDDALLAERARLGGAERIGEACAEALQKLNGEGLGAVDSVGVAVTRLKEIARLDESAVDVLSAVETGYYTLQEAARDLEHYADSVEMNPERLEQVEERLDLLRNLKRKYGDTIPEILAYRERTFAELDSLQHADERVGQLRQRVETLKAERDAANAKLHSLRVATAEQLRDLLSADLAGLAMERARFDTSIESAEPGPTGADKVEFVISPNPGEPLKPLAKIASGGEMSRLMLALKSALSRVDPVPTLVFDEIDVGVSGRVAGALARKLKALASQHQTLCVTHLPQIAAAAGTHFRIEKSVSGNRTVTTITALSPEERMEEIARLLAGAEPTDTARTHAASLISEFGGGTA